MEEAAFQLAPSNANPLREVTGVGGTPAVKGGLRRCSIELLCLLPPTSYFLRPSSSITTSGQPASDILHIGFQKPGAAFLLQPG